MKEEKDAENIPGIKLVVKESPIRFGGSVRVHDSVIAKLGCEVKDQIVLMKDEKKILRTIFADNLVAKNTVILRTKAMKDLDVKDGDEIELQLNKKILANLRNKAGDFKDSVKEKFSKDKDEDKEE
jgi:antitoxin component of MazEF toxin-antitoxin module